jgi:hypothetical protein
MACDRESSLGTRRCWRLHTWQHILFNDESLFWLRFNNERVYWRCGEILRTSVWTRLTVVEAKVVWAGICHDVRTQLKIVQGTLNAVAYIYDSLDLIVLSFLQQHMHMKYISLRWYDIPELAVPIRISLIEE